MTEEASFQIRTFVNIHHCSHDYKIPLAKANWLAQKYHDKIVSNPSWKLKEFAKDVRSTYSFDAAFSTLGRAKKIAMGEIEDTRVKHYSKVWDYAEEIKRADLDTTVKMQVDRVDVDQPAYFKRLYCCFSTTKNGWMKGCMPVIGMDGCFLKHFCKGQLLTAIGRDGNNQMFPIAWAVVEVENNDFWMWFVVLFSDDLRLGDAVENNMCETFNGCILDARGKLLIYMLEDIRLYVIERMQKRGELIEKWSQQGLVLCPRIKKKLDIHIENSRHYHAIFCGRLQFEVKSLDGVEGFVVDFDEKTCTCRRWQLSGIPCSHAITCIFKKNEDVNKFVSEWYTVEKMKETYDHYFKPLNGEKMWPKSNIDPPLPPQGRRMPGRPKKQRRREQHELPQVRRFKISRVGTVMHCSNCDDPGHNRASRKQPVREPQATTKK